ncbi:MAG: hypothetical protein ACLTV6_08140 [Christensenellales bacterium]|jgi:hypothetical protein|nr:MAG TPA: hypothetical protein [Caudoviricetes sp.]
MRRTPIHVTYEFVGDPRPDAAKIDELARMIVRDFKQDILDFYADPKNQAAFEAWKAKKAAAEAAQSQC